MKKYILLSALMHIFLFFMFGIGSLDTQKDHFGGPTSQKEDKKAQKSTSVDILDITPDISEEGDKPKNNCKPEMPHYDGIGIYQDNITGIITKAMPGYPAYNAGIRDGDRIIWQSDIDIMGPVGTIITLKVERHGNVLTFVVTRDIICYSKDSGI